MTLRKLLAHFRAHETQAFIVILLPLLLVTAVMMVASYHGSPTESWSPVLAAVKKVAAVMAFGVLAGLIWLGTRWRGRRVLRRELQEMYPELSPAQLDDAVRTLMLNHSFRDIRNPRNRDVLVRSAADLKAVRVAHGLT